MQSSKQFLVLIRNFIREEKGLESVEWMTLAVLMASLVIVIAEGFLDRLFEIFLSALETVTSS